MGVHEIRGPLALAGTEPGGFVNGDAFDILFVQHEESIALPVFALLSSHGHIANFIMSTGAQDSYDGRLDFDLISYDHLILPCKPSASVPYCLQTDPTQHDRYLVLCGTNLFSVAIGKWAYSLSKTLLTDMNFEKCSSDLLDSKLQHVFCVVGSTSESEDCITMATTVMVSSDECGICVSGVPSTFGEQHIAFVAVTSSKQFLTKFAILDDASNNRRHVARQLIRPAEQKSQNYLLEECEKILQSQVTVPKFRITRILFSRLNSSVTEEEAIAFANRVVETLMTNMRITKTAFEKAQHM
ncbi:unnamed protein product [Gongylonema pulchrum]|uniref:Proteasome assembly chaperone 3 n=1 Tax=Gongylonema pulchrum TaxID=637853 RepID=A0A183EF28_9BILA|nr:unnamed protein product [Gongylonema pulchrum]